MASVNLNENTSDDARDLLNACRRLRPDLDTLKFHHERMIQILNNASTEDAANFVGVAADYSVEGVDQDAKNAAAKKAFDELSATIGSLAAIEQFLAIVSG